MTSVAMAMIGMAMVALNWAIIIPQVAEAESARTASAKAVNFWAYRRAVVDYINANPTATGTVADASLTFASGHVRDAAWTHVIQGGTLYTYSTTAIPRGTVEAIWRHGHRALTIGLAQAGSTMTSYDGFASGFSIPAAITQGAVVVVGK